MPISNLNDWFDRVIVKSPVWYRRRRELIAQQLPDTKFEFYDGNEDRSQSKDSILKMIESYGLTIDPMLANGPEKYVRLFLCELRLCESLIKARIPRIFLIEDDAYFYPWADEVLETAMQAIETDPAACDWDVIWWHSQTPISPVDGLQYIRPYFLIPTEPSRSAIDAQKFWTWRSASEPGAMIGGREIIYDQQGQPFKNVYRGWQENLSTMALSVTWQALDLLLRENKRAVFSDFFFGWLSHEKRTNALICSPFLCCRNHQLDLEGGL